MSAEKKERFCSISRVKSTVEQIDIPVSEEALYAELKRCNVQSATVVLWQVNAVRFGTWAQGTFSLSDDAPLRTDLLIELRVFNEQGELYLRCEDGRLIGRFRTDEQGDTAEYVDTIARFWGSHHKDEAEDDAWMLLRDSSRKLELRLPAIKGKPDFVGLVTRSYIGVHKETGQAGYVDHRYCRIAAADMEEETNG